EVQESPISNSPGRAVHGKINKYVSKDAPPGFFDGPDSFNLPGKRSYLRIRRPAQGGNGEVGIRAETRVSVIAVKATGRSGFVADACVFEDQPSIGRNLA